MEKHRTDLSKKENLTWSFVPSKIKDMILSDVDAQRPIGSKDKVHAANKYSEYVKEKYNVIISGDSLRGRLSEWRKKLCDDRIPRLVDYLKLEGDWAVTSDWQIRAHDASLINAMIDVATKVHKIKKIVLGGDYIDNTLYAKFLPSTEHEKSEDQFKSAEIITERLLDEFEEIIWITANHEARFFKKLDNKLSFPRFAKMIHSAIGDKIQVSEYPYLHINGKWRVTHPHNTSIFPMRVAHALASKYRMSIMCAHGHRFGVSLDASGQELVVDTGGLFDITKMGYVMLNDSTYPVMNQGFVMLENNHPYLYGPFLTDWSKYGINYGEPSWVKALKAGRV